MSYRDHKRRRQETSPKEEFLARNRAFPLRKRTGWSVDGADYLLECGHTMVPDPYLDPEGCMPCVLCYRDGLKRARVMVDGDF